MAIKINYFNSFVLKKTVNNVTSGNAAYQPVFPGLHNNPYDYPTFGANASDDINNVIGVGGRNWIIEEARIRGGYNNTSTSYGPRAYLVEISNEQSVRTNALIYSGVYNSRTDLNETNVFSVGEEITKAVDPNYGSIQKLHALDSNLAIFQENKVSNALIDKDAIYSAEGAGSVTSTNLVIGQITPYVGEYGISANPESFAYYGYRRYFTDKYRNAVMRLSRDGLTEISQYGMSTFFREEFAKINSNFKEFTFTAIISTSGTQGGVGYITLNPSNVLTNLEKGMLVSIPQTSGSPITATVVGVVSANIVYLSNDPGTPSIGQNATFTKFIKDRLLGGWDIHNKNYVVSIQDKSEDTVTPDTYSTLSFEDDINGWTSFFTYEPNFVGSLKSKYYSFYDAEIYEHYDQTPGHIRSTFYGVTSNSSVEFIFNANPSIIKNFKTVNYEGSNGWQVESFLSDAEGFDLQSNAQQQYNDSAKLVRSYEEGLYNEGGVPYRAGFNRKENKYFANLINNSVARPNEVFFGDATTGIKGYLATVKVSTDATTDPGGTKELFAVSTEFVVSSR
ncbi:hypothetical protein OAV25_01425 [Flavobacteriaceae bacterium]|nr:hypothetical protein [Flavobacteriaceae bacterium]